VILDATIGQTYLSWALDVDSAESADRAALLERLPHQIVDCHAHVNDADTVGELSDYAWAQARSSFPAWPKEASDEVRGFLYQDRRVTRLVMAHPFRGIDHRAANAALLRAADSTTRVILCGLPDDPAYTERELASSAYVGLKMYPHYREPPFRRLSGYFPDWAVAAAAAAEVPSVVHLPVPLAECVGDVLQLADRHPTARFVLAHLGRQTDTGQSVRAAFKAAASCPRIAVDTSMATERDVHELALASFGPERVLYGSDEPFNLLRYVAFQHPDRGRRLMSPRRYHWLDETMFATYRHLADGARLVHDQVLGALLDTVDAQYGGEAPAVRAAVFASNAARWFRLDEHADRSVSGSTTEPGSR
jgi:predicted TIM-barrel fold metal-dependent hydrolase